MFGIEIKILLNEVECLKYYLISSNILFLDSCAFRFQWCHLVLESIPGLVDVQTILILKLGSSWTVFFLGYEASLIDINKYEELIFLKAKPCLEGDIPFDQSTFS